VAVPRINPAEDMVDLIGASRTYGANVAAISAVGRRAAQLAGALRGLGVTGDQRVATFQWINQEHLEAYLAIPAMGAVVHTLNLRLESEQVAWIANHAQDDVVIVDCSLVPVLARALPEMKTVRHVVVVGEADTSPLDRAGSQLHSYQELLAQQSDEFDWPTDIDERSAAAMCYTSGTTGNPKGVAYSHRSAYLHSMCMCTGEVGALTATDRILPVVPMFHVNAWGVPFLAPMVGAKLVMPGAKLDPASLIDLIVDFKSVLSTPCNWMLCRVVNRIVPFPYACAISSCVRYCSALKTPPGMRERIMNW